MSQAACRRAFDRLARAESAFLGSEFLAPVVFGRGVGVAVAGVRYALRVLPATFVGWGVFRPVSHGAAVLVRDATAAERDRYLELFPAVRMIVCAGEAGAYEAVLENDADTRFELASPVPVRLATWGEAFDAIVARFDGVQFWFDRPDDRADPELAAYLRRALALEIPPDELARPGLPGGQRRAYALAYHAAEQTRRHAANHHADARLRAALAHAGARLHGFAETHDAYRVTFSVDGRRHTSVVAKADLSVRSAGVRLKNAGAFDLTTLPGVLRESANQS